MAPKWHKAVPTRRDAFVIGSEVEILLLDGPPSHASKWAMRIAFRRVEVRQTVGSRQMSERDARRKTIRLAVERLRKNADQLEALIDE